ncbi:MULTISPECIES: helix-turn-helix domain-containing protein [Streptomyces]|uniref:helix-turn-helix domain-containing protein n=1 Tax=Streptomyces TaxID=1883 RepID=UPI0020585CB1|nr:MULTISPECIES: helix-turn-helix domain-containing protein [Streptomyces]UPT41807.1 helix-turn-helix domain-containing protein [Streptomyces sp. WAC00303]WIY76040.1 helix-turn-helix domain-containing protein [Streptomyces anulatus]
MGTEDSAPVPAPEETEKLFLRRIRTRRIEMGLSQGDLAQRANALGVPLYQQTVAKLESGHRSLKFSEAEALARALETSVPELLSSEDVNKRQPYRNPPLSVEEMKTRARAFEQMVAALVSRVHEAAQSEEAAKRRADEAQHQAAAASMGRRQLEEQLAAARSELHLTQTRIQQLEVAQTSIGMAVRLRRYDLGLTVEDISLATRIKPETIKAIEVEDYNWRPAGNPKSDVYARGTLRVLAEYLGLDGDILVDLYDREYSSSADGM